MTALPFILAALSHPEAPGRLAAVLFMIAAVWIAAAHLGDPYDR